MTELDRIIDRAKSQCGLMHDATGDIEGIRATVSSPDGTVTACVDGTGTLIDLAITDVVTSMDPRAVAALTIATIHQCVYRSGLERKRLLHRLRQSLGEV